MSKGFLYRAAPWILVAMALLVWLEVSLPGHAFIAKHFGRDAVLRLVVGLLCLYVLALEAGRRHMQASYRSLLEALRQFTSAQAGQRGGEGEPSRETQRQAVELLIGALESQDAKVRATSLEHLRRITGQDLGPDPAAWRSWLDRNLPRGE